MIKQGNNITNSSNPFDLLNENVMLLSFDKNYNIQSANQSMQEYLQIPEQEITSHNLWEDLCMELPLYISDEIKYVLAHHKTWNGNLLLKNAEGEKYWFSTTIYPLKDKLDKLVGYTLIASSGAQKETIISANKSSQNWMRAIFDDPAEANILIDTSGEIIDYNGTAFKFAKWYQHKELTVDECIVSYFEEDFQKSIEAFLHKATAGQKQQFCRTFQNTSGYEKTFDIHLRPVLSTDKIVMGVIMTVHDISDEVELEKRIKLSEKRLSDIAFINAHEVRAPLASILGLLQLLDFESVDSESQVILSHLKTSASELEGIIHKVSENAYIPSNNKRNSISA